MNDALKEIELAQAELDAADNQLAIAIEAIERALCQRISIRITTPCPNTKTRFSAIAFGKRNQSWCLFAELANGDECPLRSCTREMRAEALAGGHIARLINESGAVLRNQVAERTAATLAANELLHMLGATGEKRP